MDNKLIVRIMQIKIGKDAVQSDGNTRELAAKDGLFWFWYLKAYQTSIESVWERFPSTLCIIITAVIQQHTLLKFKF